MKKFYLNAVLFFSLFLVTLMFFDYLSIAEKSRSIIAEWTNSTSFITGSVGPDEIKPYIIKAQTPDDSTKLIIGDSVCRQMFSGLQEYNSDFTIIGSNGAITMAGQYILAKEYLDSHSEVSDIFLIVLPESLGRTFDTKLGYQYVVMPFAETDTLKDLDRDTIEIMQSVYGNAFMNPQVVYAIDRSGVNRKLYLNLLEEYASGHVLKNHFELADQYVYKIYELCQERGVTFHMYPCPVSETKKEYVDNLTVEYESSKIFEINPYFLESVYYYPSEQSADGTHFSGDYANRECYNEKIRIMLEGEEILDMLKLE